MRVWLFELDDAMQDGVFDQIGRTLQFQLVEHVAAVGFYCFYGDFEHLGNLSVGFTHGDKSQHFPFSFGKICFFTLGLFRWRLENGRLQQVNQVLRLIIANNCMNTWQVVRESCGFNRIEW